jgi:lipoprotein-anchoring transpeptidase ErfK/SrfK
MVLGVAEQMARLAGSWRTVAGRGILAGVCGGALIMTAACSGGGAGGAAGQAGSGQAAAAVAAPVVQITPAAGARAVRPNIPIRVKALQGHLVHVVVRARGRAVAGLVNAQSTEWTSRWALTPGASYVVQATAGNSAGKTVTTMSKFRTLRPARTFSASLDWLLAANQGQRYGVGLPIILNFSEPVVHKAAVQKALQVTAQRPVPGAWHWITDEQIVYRVDGYWPPHQTVTLHAHLAGVRVAAGVYGTKNLTYRFKIGAARISNVNIATHHMTVRIDGKLKRSVGVSGGDESALVYTTPSGTALTMDKQRLVIMTNPNVKKGQPGWYREPVPLAVRLTNSGIYLHETPGAEWCIGVSNCSHGCVRQSPAEALWFYDTSQLADVVHIKGTDRKMAFDDGWTFYQMPWKQWKKGSVVDYASYPTYPAGHHRHDLRVLS